MKGVNEISSAQLYPSLTAMRRQRKQMTWEYVAGFFDGEGCISLKLTNSKVENGTFVAYWKVAQSEPKILVEIQRFLKSWGIDAKVYRNHKELVVHTRAGVLFILAQTIPYLRVKREICLDVYDYLLKVEKLIQKYGQHYWRFVDRPVRPLNSNERKIKLRDIATRGDFKKGGGNVV